MMEWEIDNKKLPRIPIFGEWYAPRQEDNKK